MKIEKITIELINSGDDEIGVRVVFDPPIPPNLEEDEIELTPVIVAFESMMEALNSSHTLDVPLN